MEAIFNKFKNKEKLYNEALEEVRTNLLDKYHEDDFLMYLFSKRRHRDIMHNIAGNTFTFNAYLIRFRLNDMKTNKINNNKYNIILDWNDYDTIFAYEYIRRETVNWLKRNDIEEESPESELAREHAIKVYEEHRESRVHPYYRKPCTNIDEIIRFNPDFEFYRSPIVSKVEYLKDVKIPIVMKQI